MVRTTHKDSASAATKTCIPIPVQNNQQSSKNNEGDHIDATEPDKNPRNRQAAPMLQEIALNLNDIPKGDVLTHATNCQGTWGKGFALQLRTLFPQAYLQYKSFCKRAKKPGDLAGQCLLIPPATSVEMDKHGNQPSSPSIYIACLFTSEGYGRSRRQGMKGRDSADRILENTETALAALMDLLNEVSVEKHVKLYSPRFNSGLFGVPWTKTKEKIETCLEGSGRSWYVLERPDAGN